MAKTPLKASAPLTFDLPESLIARIELCRKNHGLPTASDVVRSAIAEFNFDRCQPKQDPHRQISVRIPSDQRARLKRCSKQKKTSVGELLRIALESMPDRPRRGR